MFTFSLGAQAGALKSTNGLRKNFYDWEYAQKVWDQMGDWDSEEKEWAKYGADFEPWLVEWKKSPWDGAAKKLLAAYPAEKRRNIERAFDIQVAWDYWFDNEYRPWIDRYRSIVKNSPNIDLIKGLKSYEQRFAEENEHRSKKLPSPCIRTKHIGECGMIPDWRSPAMKAEERKLEALRAERLKGH